MPAITTLVAVAGLAAAGAGAAINYTASKQNAAAQSQALQAQQQSEALRQQQMNLDAARRRREVIRASVAARSASLSQTVAQGAGGVGGSSLPGAQASITGREGVNELGINQNQSIGNSIFSAHQQQLQAYQSAASAQSFGAIGAGLSSLGGALMTNAGTIGKVGTFVGAKAFSAFAGGGTPSGYGRA
jgi:hypothetical protein